MNKKLKILLIFILPFLVNVVFIDYSEAKSGDLYEKYKSKFDAEMDGHYLDMVKDYDYENNTFDCGKWDLPCHIDSRILTALVGSTKLLYSGIENAVIKPSEITNNSNFRSYANGFQEIAWWMLAVFLVWQIVRIYSIRVGTPNPEDIQEALQQKIVLVVVAGILMGTYHQFVTLILNFQYEAVRAVTGGGVTQEELASAILINVPAYGIFMAIFLAVVAIVFSIAFIYRFVLFGFCYIVGLAAIPTMLNDEYNYFSIWLRVLITNSVTLFLQTICFSFSLYSMVHKGSFLSTGIDFTVGIAFCFLAIVIPGLLGNLGGSTGTSRMMGTVGRFVTRRRF
ncbi:conjugal transfer protein TrbL family protein [Alkalicoccobacillus gibsonii]|uniref:Conjugal transfer protein TrbL family protein n=1 Tax=Alkalicoccobacillus gibsonii TaxID=79881 RepID=A0ABU9VNQ0_9BACI